MSLSTYLAIIFTLCNCKLAPAIPNSCICNKGSGWKTSLCCNFKWRCLSGESQERKKKSHKHSDKMTQAFQTSAIIEVEHKTVSFVLPVDHALTAALLPLCLSPGIWQHWPWTAEMCLSECWVWQTYVLCLLSERCFQVRVSYSQMWENVTNKTRLTTGPTSCSAEARCYCTASLIKWVPSRGQMHWKLL